MYAADEEHARRPRITPQRDGASFDLSAAVAYSVRHLAQRRRSEERRQVEWNAQLRLHLRHEAHGQQRLTTEGEEVIVQADVQKDSFLAAFDAATGRERWRTARADVPTFSTPTVLAEAGRTIVREAFQGCEPADKRQADREVRYHRDRYRMNKRTPTEVATTFGTLVAAR